MGPDPTPDPDPPAQSDRVPASVAVVSGNGQRGAILTPLARDLVVQVKNAAGQPLAGIGVDWMVSSGGGVMETTTTQTDAQGNARTVWTLGSVTGRQSATANVGDLPPALFEATAVLPLATSAGGTGQIGLTGQALADSLVVRATDETGAPLAGVSVQWTVLAGGGGISPATERSALSPAATLTDSKGLARAQFVLGTSEGDNRARATVVGGAAIEFEAVGNGEASLELRGTPDPFDLDLGPTDCMRALCRQGAIRVVMLFVDFSDAPSGPSEATRDLYDRLIPGAQAYFDAVSRSRISLVVEPHHEWLRMPRKSSDYGFQRGLTYEGHVAYIRDAMSIANSQVDFAGYDVVYIAATPSEITYSPGFVVPRGLGITMDGKEIRHGVTFGNDSRQSSWGYRVTVHETGHLLGLPDLYLFNAAGFDAQMAVGGWDPMGWLQPGAHFMAWHSRKLGWISDDRILAIESGGVEAILEPLSVSGTGTKAVVVVTGPTRAVVVEGRAISGADAGLCDSGVLVYSIDTSILDGHGPITVHERIPSPTSGAMFSQCANKWDAALSPGESVVVPGESVKVGVLGTVGSSYRVRVSR